MKKTSHINVMVSSDIKEKLQQKAKQQNLSITQYIEKIAIEPVVFLDQNARLLLESLKLSFK